MQWKHIYSHPMHSVTLDSVPLHQFNIGVPHTCFTSGDSAKHFSIHPYPPYTCVNMACSGSTFAPSAVNLCILWHLIESQKLQTYTRGVNHTCLTSGDSAKHFSNHPYPSCKCVNKACSGSTSAVTQCIMWHLTVSQKLHQFNSGVPHTCLTSGDSAKHFLTTPTLLYMCQQGMQWKHMRSICSHPMHYVTLDSVPEITPKIHHGCSPHISH